MAYQFDQILVVLIRLDMILVLHPKLDCFQAKNETLQLKQRAINRQPFVPRMSETDSEKS